MALRTRVPMIDASPHRQARPRLSLLREFADSAVWLRLPEEDRIEFRGAGAVALHLIRGGMNAADAAREVARRENIPMNRVEHDVATVLAALEIADAGETVRRNDGFSADAAGFQSPRWEPPQKFPGRKYVTFPDRNDWLLLVAATAGRSSAEVALSEWLGAKPPAQRTARRLKPLVAANLRTQGSPLQIPDGDTVLRQTWLANTATLNRLAPVLRSLATTGIRAALIKGTANAMLDYRDLATRPMTDVDIAVPFADRRRAADVLTSVGFVAHAPPPAPVAHREHGGAFVRPGDLNIDLHWHVLWSSCWAGADDGFWAGAAPIEVQGAPAFAPSAELRFLVAIAHGLRYERPATRHWVADTAMILTAHGPEFDWERLRAEARTRRLVRSMREACRFLVEVMGAPIAADELRALEREPTAIFENLNFESFQDRFPRGGPARTAVVSWINQYRIAARGFRLREIVDFLASLRFHRGAPPWPVFIARMAGSVLRKGTSQLEQWLRRFGRSG